MSQVSFAIPPLDLSQQDECNGVGLAQTARRRSPIPPPNGPPPAGSQTTRARPVPLLVRRGSSLRIGTTREGSPSWDQRGQTPPTVPEVPLDAPSLRKTRTHLLINEYVECLTPRSAGRFMVDIKRKMERLKELQGKSLLTVLGFFDHAGLMKLRSVSRSWRDAVGLLVQTLNLDFTKHTNVPGNRVVDMLAHFPKLIRLEIRRSNLLRDDNVFSILRCCRDMKQLRIIHADSLSRLHFHEAFPVACGGHPFQIEELDIRACKALVSVQFPSNPDIFPGLCKLSLKSCGKLEDKVLKCMNVPSRKVDTLDFALCIRLSGDGIMPMIKACGPRLQKLSIAQMRVPDEFVKSLVQVCPNLTHLDVTSCIAVTDQGLQALSHLSSLEWLGCSKCDRITNVGLRALAAPSTSKCHGLKYIDLSENMGITDHGLKGIGKVLRKLETVILNETAVTTDGVRALVSCSENLRELQVSDCLLIDGSICADLALNCPRLERLGLANSVVRFEHLKPLNHKCKLLKTLDLTNTRCVIDKSEIKKLLWTCHGLTHDSIFL
eukprot:ANDGO_00646.mRNA.1 putative F-box/LRR-repeat protein C02F5.7